MPHDSRSFTQHEKECIVACFACAEICNACEDGMIVMEHESDMQLTARCIRQCRECADSCLLAAQWVSRQSPLAERACQFCAEVCDVCAETCERHAPHHALCGPCARECRRCAELCRAMAATVATS